MRPVFVKHDVTSSVVTTVLSPAIIAILPMYIGYLCGSDPSPFCALCSAGAFFVVFSIVRNITLGWAEARLENASLCLALQEKEKADQLEQERLRQVENDLATLAAQDRQEEDEDIQQLTEQVLASEDLISDDDESDPFGDFDL